MVIATATISIGTLHTIVAVVLGVIATSRIVRLGRILGQRMQERSTASDRFEGVSGVG